MSGALLAGGLTAAWLGLLLWYGLRRAQPAAPPPPSRPRRRRAVGLEEAMSDPNRTLARQRWSWGEES